MKKKIFPGQVGIVILLVFTFYCGFVFQSGIKYSTHNNIPANTGKEEIENSSQQVRVPTVSDNVMQTMQRFLIL